MHVHLGVVEALKTFAYVIIIGFFWRWLSMKYHQSSVGRAMAFVY